VIKTLDHGRRSGRFACFRGPRLPTACMERQRHKRKIATKGQAFCMDARLPTACMERQRHKSATKGQAFYGIGLDR
jgi:hypothetical protein